MTDVLLAVMMVGNSVVQMVVEMDKE